MNFQKAEFSLRIFKKYWNFKFHENPSTWRDGHTQRQTWRS